MLYGNADDLKTYALERGDFKVANGQSGELTEALQRASDYVRTRYVSRMPKPVDPADPDVVEAAYIAAMIEFATPGLFSRVTQPTDKVLTEVKGIKWQMIGKGGEAVSTSIEALLRPRVAILPGIMVV